MDLWERYIQMRRDNQSAGDKKGRGAFRYYLENRESMDSGVEVTNPNRFIKDLCQDGTPEQVSTIQFAFDYITDHSDEVDPIRFFAEEFQNDPPALEESNSGISAAIVQNKLNGYPKGVVPAWATRLTAFMDVGRYNCHWTVIGWTGGARGAIVDYGVAEVYTDGKTDEAIEQAILNAIQRWSWETNTSPYKDENGNSKEIDLTLIDSGFHPTPVYKFCATSGLRFRPSKGHGESMDGSKSHYYGGQATANRYVGEHWYMSRQEGGHWLVGMDADYWKRWVHDRFLTPSDRPGSLSMFGADPFPHFSFSKHIVAEIETEEFVKGKGLKRFWKKIHRNNHWFDCCYGASCAAAMVGVRLLQEGDTIANLIASDYVKKPEDQPQLKPFAHQRRDGRGWVGAPQRPDGRGWLER
jgi:phage terminase large subunit GpA-like protein